MEAFQIDDLLGKINKEDDFLVKMEEEKEEEGEEDRLAFLELKANSKPTTRRTRQFLVDEDEEFNEKEKQEEQ